MTLPQQLWSLAALEFTTYLLRSVCQKKKKKERKKAGRRLLRWRCATALQGLPACRGSGSSLRSSMATQPVGWEAENTVSSCHPLPGDQHPQTYFVF